MNSIAQKIDYFTKQIMPARLIAVSKTYPIEMILEAYNAGQRDFGENKVQDLVEKYEALPKDIRWHLIGHLQTNKVKYIAPFVHIIHSVDSEKLLLEINKQGQKCGRTINCLLQIHISDEETKFGMSIEEAKSFFNSNGYHNYQNVQITGLMGMASNTDDIQKISQEFTNLKSLFQQINEEPSNTQFKELSMGMSNDYEIAVKNASTMVRIGSAIFGNRVY